MTELSFLSEEFLKWSFHLTYI